MIGAARRSGLGAQRLLERWAAKAAVGVILAASFMMSSAVVAVAAGGVPDAPASVSAVSGDSAATVSWIAPADGGAPIIGYVVTPYRNGAAQSAQTFASDAVTETISGLTNGVWYRFTVAAYNANGTGLTSGLSPELLIGSPGAPPSVSAVAGSLSATVSWTAPVPNGSPITRYRIWVGKPGLLYAVQGFFVDATVTTTTVTGLAAGEVYFFRVRAWNGYGNGPQTGSNAVTIGGGVPVAPSGVSAVPGEASATVTWIAPYDGGSPIIGYVITPYLSGVAQPEQTSASDAVSVTVTELMNGGSYTFAVAAFNANGTGTPSSASDPIVVGSPTAPGSPVAASGDGSATVSWTAPASVGGAPIIGYVVTPYRNGAAQSAQTFASDAVTETISGLTNGVWYRFTVAAYNANGTGLTSGLSPELLIGSPGAPPSVSAVAGSLSATVSWTAPVPNGSPITRYRIWVGKPGLLYAVQGFFVDATVTTTTVTGLAAGEVYFFRVRAWNGYGNGPQTGSNAVTVLS